MAGQIQFEKVVARVRGWASNRPRLLVSHAPAATWATQGVLASAAGFGLVVVLLGGVLLAPRGGGAPAPSTAAPSPTRIATPTLFAYSTPSPAWTPSWSPSLPSDTPSPSPTLRADASLGPVMSIPPLDGGNAIALSVGAQGPCLSLADLVGAKGVVYFECNDAIVAFDLATNKVSARYTPGLNLPPCPQGHCVGKSEPMVLDGSGRLWLGTRFIDLRSGVSTDVQVLNAGGSMIEPGDILAGGGDDIWMWNDGAALTLIHPSKVRAGSAPVAQQLLIEDGFRQACKSVVLTTVETHDGWLWTHIKRPSGYEALEPGLLDGSFELNGSCWLLLSDGAPNDQRTMHAVRLGPSGLDSRSPGLRATILILDNTLWVTTPISTHPTLLQRINLTSWQPEGPVFLTSCYNLHAGAGSVWCSDGSADRRLDLPLSPTAAPPTATPTVLQTLAPTATATGGTDSPNATETP